MNDTKHTPTPWIATRGASEHPYSIEGATKTVAYIKMQIEPITTEANARFICRACNSHDELVEALGDICNRLSPGAPDIASHDLLDIRERAKQALSHAKGGASKKNDKKNQK